LRLLRMVLVLQMYYTNFEALALAMSRDGSSGGVIRMMVLTGDKDPHRLMFAEPNIPKFWEKE